MQFLEEFRELATKGEYESALQSFKEFGNEIGAMERDKKTSMIEGYSWKQIKNELQKEEHLVKEIMNELKFFSGAQSFGPQISDQPLDLFQKCNKPQKSIQERYESHISQSKPLKNDRLRQNKRLLPKKQQQSSRNRHGHQDNKRKNILSPIRKQRERKEHHHVNPKRPSSKKQKEQKEEIPIDDGKYRAPSGIDNYLVETIENSVIQRVILLHYHKSTIIHCRYIIYNTQNIGVKWGDIASLHDVKKTLKEVVILPTIIPEYFKGIRKPFRGILLFGPPGTGKTMLAKAVASSAKCTFFNVSPSLVISKWRGDSPKLIRILFDMARYYAPSVIFFDEIDAIASSRGGSNQHDASRQMKSELLIQMDGVGANANDSEDDESNDDEANNTNDECAKKEDKENLTKKKKKSKHVMVLAATNYPWALDEALRRRLEKRIYIGLPDTESRITLFKMYFKDLDMEQNIDFDKLSAMTEGYNGSDIQVICRNASMIPMRKRLQNIDVDDLESLKCSDMESKITQEDIESVIHKIKSSVGKEDVIRHKEWFHQFGSL